MKRSLVCSTVLSLCLCVVSFVLAAPLYTIHDLGPTTALRINAVNDAGVMAGIANNQQAAKVVLGHPPVLLGEGQAHAINEANTIVGDQFRWTPREGYHPFMPAIYATGVNDAETVVGYRGTFPSITPVTWVAGHVGVLLTLGGRDGYAYAINSPGDIVGESEPAGSTTFHATLWPITGGVVDLDTMPAALSIALAVNTAQEVVGDRRTPGTPPHAFRWTSATGMQDLGVLPGYFMSSARGINDAGVIVGFSEGGGPFPPPDRAVRWQGGVIDDLNALVDAPGWVLEFANAINTPGWIVGSGRLNNVSHAFVLVPIPLSVGECPPPEHGRSAQRPHDDCPDGGKHKKHPKDKAAMVQEVRRK